MKILSLILGLTISIISILFLLIPPLILGNWNILASLATLFLMITLLTKKKKREVFEEQTVVLREKCKQFILSVADLKLLLRYVN